MQTLYKKYGNVLFGGVLVLLLAIGLFLKKNIPQQESFNAKTYLALHCPQKGSSLNANCFEKLIRDTVYRKGVPQAFSLIEEAATNNDVSGQNCHALSHAIGEETYELFAKNTPFALSPNTSFCAYGFYHGFMERLVQRTKDVKQARSFCLYVDQQLKKVTADASLQCFHGIGHGTATVHDPRIQGSEKAILDPALSLCKEASDTDDELYRCASGAFNAIAIYYMNGEYKLPLNPQDPFRVCREQPAIYKEPCYGNMNTVVAAITKGDLLASAALIQAIDEDIYARPAIRYMTALLAADKKETPEQLITTCRTIQKRLETDCIMGVIHGLIEHGTPGQEYAKALMLCQSSTIPLSDRPTCIGYVIHYARSIYTKEKVHAICGEIPQQYKDICGQTY